MTTHTPGPWHVVDSLAIYGKHGAFSAAIADCDFNLRTDEENAANAEFIVTACNNHAALLAERDEIATRRAETVAMCEQLAAENERLRGALRGMVECQKHGGLGFDCLYCGDNALETARAAIAAATKGK